MLGELSKRKRKKLEESGTRAPATIVEIADKGMTITSGNEHIVSNTKVILKVKLNVEPEGQPAFEIEEKFRFSQFGIPSAGQKVAVIFDPDDHDTIMLDDDPVATVSSMMAGTGASAEQQALITNLTGASLGGADAAQLQAMAQQFSQQNPAAFGQPMGAPAAPAAVDPVEQLTKLSALKDKGVLTDAEFAEQKAKILGS
jgi:hypothetical protein